MSKKLSLYSRLPCGWPAAALRNTTYAPRNTVQSTLNDYAKQTQILSAFGGFQKPKMAVTLVKTMTNNNEHLPAIYVAG